MLGPMPANIVRWLHELAALVASILGRRLQYNVDAVQALVCWEFRVVLHCWCWIATRIYSTLLYSTLLYSTLLYSTLLYSTPLHSTPLHSTHGKLTRRSLKAMPATWLWCRIRNSTPGPCLCPTHHSPVAVGGLRNASLPSAY